jgi:hypothetical protein
MRTSRIVANTLVVAVLVAGFAAVGCEGKKDRSDVGTAASSGAGDTPPAGSAFDPSSLALGAGSAQGGAAHGGHGPSGSPPANVASAAPASGGGGGLNDACHVWIEHDNHSCKPELRCKNVHIADPHCVPRIPRGGRCEPINRPTDEIRKRDCALGTKCLGAMSGGQETDQGTCQ